jgi:hypothetical protein
MSDVSFSLTEKWIIDPVLTLRAPPSPDGNSEGLDQMVYQITKSLAARRIIHISRKAIGTMWQLTQSEIIARVLALFTSLCAAADCFIHLFSGVYKGLALGLRKICKLGSARYSTHEIRGHFKQAGWYSFVWAVGTPLGVVWPGFLRYFRFIPSAPPIDLKDAPEEVKKLADAVMVGDEAAPFDRLKQFWEKSKLEEKHWFVLAFSQSGTPIYKEVRTELADPTVYRPVNPYLQRKATWLAQDEITAQLRGVDSIFKQAFFFHATPERSLKSILKTKRVEVRHEKSFKGAFVSTKPEINFGRCVLAFRRNIERVSPLEHGFVIDKNTYWAGFSRDIPVEESTLAYIALVNPAEGECSKLEALCKEWSGRSISVVPFQEANNYCKSIRALGLGIPKEWPTGNENFGRQVIHTLQVRAEALASPLPARLFSGCDPSPFSGDAGKTGKSLVQRVLERIAPLFYRIFYRSVQPSSLESEQPCQQKGQTPAVILLGRESSRAPLKSREISLVAGF